MKTVLITIAALLIFSGAQALFAVSSEASLLDKANQYADAADKQWAEDVKSDPTLYEIDRWEGCMYSCEKNLKSKSVSQCERICSEILK